jgi:LemA protein
MTGTGWLTLVLAAVLLFWMIGAYNRLVALRNAISAAFGQIDEQLRRRQLLLQALAEALRPAMAADLSALDALGAAVQQVQAAADATRPRACSAAAAASLAVAEGVLSSALARWLLSVEQHQELREREDVALRIAELRDIDIKLGFGRQLFNDASLTYNRAVNQFPTSLLTPLFRFQSAGRL